MVGHPSDLEVGEIIEIKYRVPRPVVDDPAEPQFFDRWIMAEIIHQDGEALPIARLADGQFTDIRAYMTWRRIARAAKNDASRVEH
jgi:hypothetical protein